MRPLEVALPGLLAATAGLGAIGITAVGASHAPPPTPAWGYESGGIGGGGRILSYDIGSDTFGAECVPSPSGNGAGLAFDPADERLFYTVLFGTKGFDGDGLIHKTSVPPACAPSPTIPFGDGPGGVVQDSVGALDVDPDDGSLWAAGYLPLAGRSYLYNVNRSTGAIVRSCWVQNPVGTGNDSLTVAKIAGLGGSGKYLLTDAGGVLFDPVMAVDAAGCAGGSQAPVVATFPVFIANGIDYERGVLITATRDKMIRSFGPPPFSTIPATMGSGTLDAMRDIAVQGFRSTSICDHPPLHGVGDIVGSAGPDLLFGTPGDDRIFGLGGDDRIDGRGGADVILGGDGNDILVGGPGDDVLCGGPGDDRLLGQAGDDGLQGDAGRDVVLGGDGDDLLRGSGNDDFLDGGVGTNFNDGGPGVDQCLNPSPGVNC